MSHATPAGPSADRNLLFGILAVQMDFVTRDALIAGMNAWVLAKQRPLGDLLVDQQALTAEHRTLLDALVAAHVRQHGDDPARSLAALGSSAAPAVGALQQVQDPNVRASLRQVPATLNTGDDPYRTVAEPPGARPRFRILRPHAKGGLGEVFVAHDEELNRPVALKEIQARHAGDRDSRGRFMLEAEITGRLEHPGVVPVYGLGTYADGRPFYAMRFIEGQDLREAIERFHAADELGRDPGERRLAYRELLGRFVDVCNAVAFAHSRGVLHRDLKPGNVMLGKYGETLVVDWGLAKATGHKDAAAPAEVSVIQPRSGGEVTPTRAGSALGTPACMSPEQAAGQLDKVGPASDIYSLGATLYTLLTGRAPVNGADVGAPSPASSEWGGRFPATGSATSSTTSTSTAAPPWQRSSSPWPAGSSGCSSTRRRPAGDCGSCSGRASAWRLGPLPGSPSRGGCSRTGRVCGPAATARSPRSTPRRASPGRAAGGLREPWPARCWGSSRAFDGPGRGDG